MESISFAPSRVDGIEGVESVTVYPDRLELLVSGQTMFFLFIDMVQWPKPVWLRRLLYRIGIRPKWMPVGERDWFHPPHEMFFRFYTEPALTIFMPLDESKDSYENSYFRQIQQVMWSGGFDTYDLG